RDVRARAEILAGLARLVDRERERRGAGRAVERDVVARLVLLAVVVLAGRGRRLRGTCRRSFEDARRGADRERGGQPCDEQPEQQCLVPHRVPPIRVRWWYRSSCRWSSHRR